MATLTASPGVERLSKRNLWGYSLGGIGRDMTYTLVNVYLTLFILFTKGLSTTEYGAVGIIFIVCRIFDGCNDPFMGMLIEKTRTKIGKFKPWILAGCFSNIVIILLLFFVPLQGASYVIFFAFGYLLWGITYTMNDISYWGMMPSLTSHPTDRNNLSTIANVGAGVGAGLCVILIPTLTAGGTALGGNTQTAYQIIACVVCVLFAACQVMTCCVVKEKPLPPATAENKDKRGLGAMFKVVLKNDQLLVTAGSMLLYNVGSAIMNSLYTYWVYLRFGYNGILCTVFSVLTGISMAIIVFYPILSKKLTRKQLAKICVSTVVAGYALMLTLALITGSIDGADSIGIMLDENTILSVPFIFIGLCGAIASFGQALYYQVLTISVSNTIEYNDLKTGKRDEGIIFAVRPFMAKMGSSIVKAIETVALIALGIDLLAEDISEQVQLNALGRNDESTMLTNINNILADATDGTDQWVIVCMAVFPILFILASFILYMKKFKIDEKEYDRICEEIKIRDAAAENGECTCDCDCECDCAGGECTCDCDENCDETCTCSCHAEAPVDEVVEEVAADETPAEEVAAEEASAEEVSVDETPATDAE